MIRRATVDDVEAIVAMGLRFQASSSYATYLRATPASITTLTEQVLASPDCALWVAERAGHVVGMLAASLYTQPMTGERIGTEIVWWMDPEARGGRDALRLVQTAQAWAKDRGALWFQMMAPSPEVGAFYEKLGFVLMEWHYMRRIA